MNHLISQKQQTQLSQDLYQYRLRSARAKRRAVIAHRDKHLLRLNRRSNELFKLRKAQPWIELSPPIMRGWKRTFVLRDDVAGSKDAAMYERILAHINNVQYAHRPDFKKKKRRRGKKVYLPTNQYLLKLHSWTWQKAGFTEKEAAMFEVCEEYTHPSTRTPEKRYVFREPWRYVLQISPNLITMIRYRNSLIESEEAEIDQYLECRNRRHRLDKLLYGRSYKWLKRPDDREYTSARPFRCIPLHRLLTVD